MKELRQPSESGESTQGYVRTARDEQSRPLRGVMKVRTTGEATNDRLLDALLAASVAVVLVGWVTALVYLGFRLL